MNNSSYGNSYCTFLLMLHHDLVRKVGMTKKCELKFFDPP